MPPSLLSIGSRRGGHGMLFSEADKVAIHSAGDPARGGKGSRGSALSCDSCVEFHHPRVSLSRIEVEVPAIAARPKARQSRVTEKW